jgi:hypothetical protein
MEAALGERQQKTPQMTLCCGAEEIPFNPDAPPYHEVLTRYIRPAPGLSR